MDTKLSISTGRLYKGVFDYLIEEGHSDSYSAVEHRFC